MHRALLAACFLGLAAVTPVAAQEAEARQPSSGTTVGVWQPIMASGVATSDGCAATASDNAKADTPTLPPWEAVWGMVGADVFAAGPKVAPNGEKYHPSFTLDLDFNFWVFRSLGLYLFADIRFWNERPEYGVTNAKDSGLGFSKRQFDLVGGPAWNYFGPWELRLDAYTFNNLNRGSNFVTPVGLNDGFGFENRYYLSKEYAQLGHAGFDVARADFLSLGYYITKDMVGNDGKTFNPGLMLRAYLTYDLWDWPVYAYGDGTFICERSMQPKLLLFDLGLAARPFRCWPSLSALHNWEFRLGVENTADLDVGTVQNLWYGSMRLIF